MVQPGWKTLSSQPVNMQGLMVRTGYRCNPLPTRLLCSQRGTISSKVPLFVQGYKWVQELNDFQRGKPVMDKHPIKEGERLLGLGLEEGQVKEGKRLIVQQCENQREIPCFLGSFTCNADIFSVFLVQDLFLLEMMKLPWSVLNL